MYFRIFFYYILTFFLSCCSFPKIQAQSLGNGRDGSPNISGIINTYTAVTENLNKCEKKISVKNENGFSIGDLVLIIQMQGATINNTNTSAYGTINDYANAGNYEFALVDSLGASSIFLKNPVLRDFSASGKIQLIRVPQYENPVVIGTLLCKPWDGETGGVLAFDSKGTIMLNANINVNGKGFRGGEEMNGFHLFAYSHSYIGESFDPDSFGLKGEGIAFDGVFPFTSGRGAPANGGGGGNIHTAGGGGGANYGCGGKGGWGYVVSGIGEQFDMQGIGGYALNYLPEQNKVFLGGGGGAGHQHYNNGTSGAKGGGIVIITADSIDGNSKTITANGNNSASSGGFGDGAGGAGAGGTVVLSCQNFVDTLFVSLRGGDGGSTILKGFGPGGGGGGGVLWMPGSVLPSNVLVSSVSGGEGGVAGGMYYGAESGCDGGISYNLSIAYYDYYEGVDADFIFSPSFISENNLSVSFTNFSRGASDYMWHFGDKTVSDLVNPIHSYLVIAPYEIQLVASDSICSDTVRILLGAEFLTNVFTPNGDGVNDEFYFLSLDSLINAEITIFNRWGKPVYTRSSSMAKDLKWDGKLDGQEVPEGTYFYVINYTILSGEQKAVKGNLTLLR